MNKLMSEPENIAEPEGAEHTSPTTDERSITESSSAEPSQDTNESYSSADLRELGAAAAGNLKPPAAVHRHSPS
jgi:hypothetical protein